MGVSSIIHVTKSTTRILGIGSGLISLIAGLLVFFSQNVTSWFLTVFLATLGAMLISEGISTSIHIKGSPSGVLNWKNLLNLLSVTVGGMVLMSALVLIPLVNLALVPTVTTFFVSIYMWIIIIGGVLGVANIFI